MDEYTQTWMDEYIQAWIDKIDAILLDSKYEFADNILSSIKKWIVDNKYITNEQENVIINIPNAHHY